eukprot:CAMPEP_0197035078 /NCGR_PEP_ID=MMETSP1384-20130603/12965_1 /TAXON_ID=29189 /ORGANISM="Ammonia sp." /LENGTH=923 /DNA_ID=CAMNT_0042465089 /DNA_START=39 /DNA_END=2810 /DNA_ORIENTATION=+
MADDWTRSSFFNADTEQTIPISNTPNPDDEDSDDEFDIDLGDTQHQNPYADTQPTEHPPTKDAQEAPNNAFDNPIIQELIQIMLDRFETLVEKGFLNADFLNRVRNDPEEILRFIRQNRAVVGDQLNRRLDPSIRPKREQLEQLGIVPRGYFSKGHQNAMTRKHRRKSSAAQDLAHLIQLRPKPEEVVAKGYAQRSTMERYVELDDNKLDDDLSLEYSIKDAMRTSVIPTNNSNTKKKDNHSKQSLHSIDEEKQIVSHEPDHQPTTVSAEFNQSNLSHSGDLINRVQRDIATDQFETQMQDYYDTDYMVNSYGAAPNGSAADGNNAQQSQQQAAQQQTWEISILNTLLFKTIAEALRKSCIDTQKQEQFVLVQMEEMNREMKTLRDDLDKYFLDDEPDVLAFQKEEDMIRDKFHAIQKKLLEISTKQNGIHEKLRILHSVEKKMIDLQNTYDKQLGQLRKSEEEVLKDLKEQRVRREKAIKIRGAEKSHSNWAMAKLDYTISIARKQQIDGDFVQQLDGFLGKLRSISENQNTIVRDFDFAIEELESHLLSIRHDMSKVRTMTFKKIYDLHKEVEIAESLELGNRRLSVASATEIERERRHHTTKIQRQLNTLNNQIKLFNYRAHEKNLREIIDVQMVMSDTKLKSFFSVFNQCFAQTICDIDICYQNLNCLLEEKESQDQMEFDNIASANTSSSASLNGGFDDDVDDLYNRRNEQRRDDDRKHKTAWNGMSEENRLKIRQLCMEFYGVSHVLSKISLSRSHSPKKDKANADLTLVEKIVHCMKFIQICKNALLYEMHKAYYQMNVADGHEESALIDFATIQSLKFKIDTSRLFINEIIIIIARKLSTHDHTLYDLDMTNDDQVPSLAQQRVKNVFEAIIKAQDLTKIFKRKPLSAMQVASAVLKYVFGIEINEESTTESYLG